MSYYALLELASSTLGLGLEWLPTSPVETIHNTRRLLLLDAALQKNYVGCSIFLAYILAALILTASILRTLYGSYQAHLRVYGQLRSPTASSMPGWYLVAYWSVMAIISFSTLSYNMIMFLVSSFQHWDIRNAAAVDSLDLAPRIWIWVTTSSLFSEFALGLFDNDIGFKIVFCSLLGTASGFIMMATQGQRLRVPRIWLYFVLAQILPTSFVICLFRIAMLLQPPPVWLKAQRRTIVEAQVNARRRMLSVDNMPLVALVTSPWGLTEIFLRFFVPYVAHDIDGIMLIVVLVRLSLLIPSLSDASSLCITQSTQSATLGLVIAGLLRLRRCGHLWDLWPLIGPANLLNLNYAALTLIRDGVLLVIALVPTTVDGIQADTSQDAKAIEAEIEACGGPIQAHLQQTLEQHCAYAARQGLGRADINTALEKTRQHLGSRKPS